MKTVTIVIGNSDNRLTQQEWSGYVCDVNSTVDRIATSTYFTGGSAYDSSRQSACWVVAVLDLNLQALQQQLTLLRKAYRQDAVAFVAGTTELI